MPRTPISPYVSLNYSEADRDFTFPFGVNFDLDRRWSLLPMYDGHRSHLLLNYRERHYGVSLMSIGLERFGVSITLGF